MQILSESLTKEIQFKNSWNLLISKIIIRKYFMHIRKSQKKYLQEQKDTNLLIITNLLKSLRYQLHLKWQSQCIQRIYEPNLEMDE